MLKIRRASPACGPRNIRGPPIVLVSIDETEHAELVRECLKAMILEAKGLRWTL